MAEKIKGTAVAQRQYEDDGGEISYSFNGNGSEEFTEQPATLVLTDERVFTEIEVRAYVEDLLLAHLSPGSIVDRVTGSREPVYMWVYRAIAAVNKKHGITNK